MSRTNNEMNRVPFPAIPDELDDIVHKFSPEPTIKGREQALAFLRGEIADPISGEKLTGIEVATFAITNAVEKRQIEFFRVGNFVYFSCRGLTRWIFAKYSAPKISA